MDVTQLWAAETALDHAATSQFQPLRHTAGNRFAERGVGPGDRVYVLHVGTRDGFADRRVHLAGRLTVASAGVIAQDEAAAALEVQPDELWEARDHLLAEDGTHVPMDFGRVLPADVLRRLRFLTDAGTTGLDVDDDGRIGDRQQLRGVRRLAPGSAELLDAFLAAADADLPERRIRWVLDELHDLLDLVRVSVPLLADTDAPAIARAVDRVAETAAALTGGTPANADGEAPTLDAYELTEVAVDLGLLRPRVLGAAPEAPLPVVRAFEAAVDDLVAQLAALDVEVPVP